MKRGPVWLARPGALRPQAELLAAALNLLSCPGMPLWAAEIVAFGPLHGESCRESLAEAELWYGWYKGVLIILYLAYLATTHDPYIPHSGLAGPSGVTDSGLAGPSGVTGAAGRLLLLKTIAGWVAICLCAYFGLPMVDAIEAVISPL